MRASPEAGERLGYLPQLDGLRALAVSLVLVHHLLQPSVFGGWVGVDIFFVLSGFLISTLLLQEWKATGALNLRRFYLRRLLRLYPALLVALVGVLPVALLSGISPAKYLLFSTIAALYVSNLVVTLTGHGIGPWLHTWTLALEEQFYVAWPGVVLLMWRLRASLIILAAVIAAIALIAMTGGTVFFNPSGTNFNPFWTSGGLLIGCALALLRGDGRFYHYLLATWVGVAGWFLLIGAIALGSFEATVSTATPLAVVGTALLLPSFIRGGVVSSVMSVRPMVFLGRISYEVYLWHFALLVCLAGAFAGLRGVVVVVVVIATLGASIASHYLVSRPLTKALRPRIG